MVTVVQRTEATASGGLLVGLGAVLGYGVVLGVGFAWPGHPAVAVVASIAVSLVIWLAAALWFQRRTGWHRSVGLVIFAVALVFPMVGTATLGTDLALERQADRVQGAVTHIDVERSHHRDGKEAWTTTYTFADEDGRELGTVDYRGDRQAHGLEVGDRTELMSDPRGDLPLKLAERVDSSADLAMTVLGVVLFTLGGALGLAWPALRPGRQRIE